MLCHLGYGSNTEKLNLSNMVTFSQRHKIDLSSTQRTFSIDHLIETTLPRTIKIIQNQMVRHCMAWGLTQHPLGEVGKRKPMID
jgi:hypothetical protein